MRACRGTQGLISQREICYRSMHICNRQAHKCIFTVFVDKIQCVLDKLDDSLKLSIPNTFEKLLYAMKNYGKRKNKLDLIQLVKKIRTEADELCMPKPKRVLSQQQLNKASQDDILEEAHIKLATVLPTSYKDDIIPEHLIKRLIALAGPQEQAEF